MALWDKKESKKEIKKTRNLSTDHPGNVFSWQDMFHSIYSGIIAGIPPAFLSRPILVVITPMHTEMKRGIFNVVKAIYRTYGWRGFTNGLIPSLLASVPGTPLMYTGTHVTTQILGKNTPAATLLSGYTGMAAGCLVYVPVTIVNQSKQTLSVNSDIQNSSYLDVARKLYHKKGFPGFYTGYWLQTVSFGTANALGLFFTSKIREIARAHEYSSDSTAFIAYLLGYTAAGFLTNPLELIKRQRQAAWANPTMFPDKSALGVVKRVVREQGILGLYRGAHVYGFWAATRFGAAYATGDAVKKIIDHHSFLSSRR